MWILTLKNTSLSIYEQEREKGHMCAIRSLHLVVDIKDLQISRYLPC